MRTGFRVSRRNGGNHSVNDTDPPGPSQVVPCNWRKPGPYQLAQTAKLVPSNWRTTTHVELVQRLGTPSERIV